MVNQIPNVRLSSTNKLKNNSYNKAPNMPPIHTAIIRTPILAHLKLAYPIPEPMPKLHTNVSQTTQVGELSG